MLLSLNSFAGYAELYSWLDTHCLKRAKVCSTTIGYYTRPARIPFIHLASNASRRMGNTATTPFRGREAHTFAPRQDLISLTPRDRHMGRWADGQTERQQKLEGKSISGRIRLSIYQSRLFD